MESRNFGRYEITAELGRGAMGVVYKASDPVLSRIVAIKTVNLALALDEREEYEARFYQEAKAAGGLSHPNIVTIYDLGNAGDVAYMAMEFLEGRELREMIGDSNPLTVRQAISIAAQVAEGLGYAHERGVVHRDIKPANIMILAGDLAKITDFGIARLRTSDVKTQTGMRLGSPKYMSPEQVLGKRTDHQSDIFSLGIVLYEMLTGKTPFSGNSLEALMYQTIHFVPPPPSRINPEIPEMLDLVIAKMLEKATEDRYATAKELASDLRECEQQYASQRSGSLGARGAVTTGLRAPLPALNLEFQSTAELEEIKRSRSKDAAGGPDVGAAALGISQTFDSFEATQKLAKEVGMAREFEDFSATTKFAKTVLVAQGESTGGRVTASLPEDVESTTTKRPWQMSNREKLFTSSVLLIATLIAILIVVY